MECMVENINKLYTEGFQVPSLHIGSLVWEKYINILFGFFCPSGRWIWMDSAWPSTSSIWGARGTGPGWEAAIGWRRGINPIASVTDVLRMNFAPILDHFLCWWTLPLKQICYIIEFPGNGAVEDWYNFSASASIRSWPKDGEVDSPFKTGDKAAIRNIVPGGDDPYMIKIDIAHTYAICGYGKDDLASVLVFLSCRCLLFGGRKIEDQLDNAFQSFNNWCVVNKKTTSITGFDYQTLKITSLLDQSLPLVPQDVHILGPDMLPVNGRSASQVAGVSQRTRQGLRHSSTGSLVGWLSGINRRWWGSSILVWDMYFLSVVNSP